MLSATTTYEELSEAYFCEQHGTCAKDWAFRGESLVPRGSVRRKIAGDVPALPRLVMLAARCLALCAVLCDRSRNETGSLYVSRKLFEVGHRSLVLFRNAYCLLADDQDTLARRQHWTTKNCANYFDTVMPFADLI
jgi:hypothetical protein